MGTSVEAASRTAGKRARREDGSRTTLFNFRARPSYLEWVDGMARRDRMSRAALMDRALIAYARATGYQIEAPARGGA